MAKLIHFVEVNQIGANMHSDNIKKSNTNIMRPAITAIAMSSAVALALPMSAFAATMVVSQQGYSGGENPSSHIVVTDASGAVVAEQDYAGGDAGAITFELDPGEYYVDATADGYDFTRQGGQLTDGGANVMLTAKAISTITIQLQAEGIDDFSGITVSLYQGTDTSGEPKAQAVTNSSGEVVLNGVPAGDYTVVLTDVPENIAATGIPTTMPVTASSDGTPAALIIAPEVGAGNTSGEREVEGSVVNASVADEDGNAVAGVQLALMQDGKTIQNATTSAGGTASFNGVEDGSYTVEVQRVPSGYTAPDAKTVEVAGGDVSVDFVLGGSAIGTTRTDTAGVPQTGDTVLMSLIAAGIASATAVGGTLVASKRRRRD